jgi:hypothetical protein
MVSSGMLRRVALVRTEFSEELSASFIGVTRIDDLPLMMFLVTDSCHPDEGDAKFFRNFGSFKSHTA